MRRKHDFYPTPDWATKELLKHVTIIGNVLECCVGDGAIADVLGSVGSPVGGIWRNDIDPHWNDLDFAGDATDPLVWDSFHARDFDWTVTNPPFNQAAKIVPLAYEHSIFGIAMLLRLSYLEPVEDRGAWLNKHPPTTLIVLPRISFTGDGKTDNVTCAWMVWEKTAKGQRIIVAENPRFAVRELEWVCDGCGRTLHPSSLTRVGIGVHHYDFDKPSVGGLNCGLVRQRPRTATASAQLLARDGRE